MPEVELDTSKKAKKKAAKEQARTQAAVIPMRQMPPGMPQPGKSSSYILDL